MKVTCFLFLQVALVGTFYMLGLLIGSFLSSWPADRFGRKPLAFLFVLAGGGANLVGGMLNEYWSYLVVR